MSGANNDASPLSCSVEARGDTAFVAPVGELDIATAPLVDGWLADARCAGSEVLILDLRNTTFIDSTAVHLALAWHERARCLRFRFALIEGPEAVRRVIDLAGAHPVLNFVE